MIEIGFVLSKSRRSPSVDDILIALHQSGLPVTADSPHQGSGYGFELSDGSSLVASFVDAPHPNLSAITLTSRWLGTELDASKSHLMVVLYGPEDASPGTLDVVLMRAIAAIADATDAVAARTGLGFNYWTIDDLESELNGLDEAQVLSSRLAIGCDVAESDDKRLSILSTGLVRYGAEDFLILAPKEKKDVAMDLLWSLADDVRFNDEDADVLARVSQLVEGLSQPPTQIVSPINKDENVIEIVLGT